MKYSIDTSAILEGYNRLYPPDILPTLWIRMGDLIQCGNMKATEMVRRELERKDDEAMEWAKSQRLFEPIDEDIQRIVTNIMAKFPRIVAKGGQKNMADPFVVAFAKQHEFTVVTAERRQGSINKPTMTFLCQQLEVPVISLLDLIRQEKWQFR
jgi:hypothetical protein